MIDLSILICTIPGREKSLAALLYSLESLPNVQVMIDDGKESVGFKRQRLLERSRGEYVCFLDDDDSVKRWYVTNILKAIELKPDVVGFKGIMTTNGGRSEEFSISMTHPYKKVNGIYLRYNNHLSPIKREIAIQIGYKDMTYAEDHDYAKRLHESGLVKTEYFIDKYMYYYHYDSKKSSNIAS